MRRVQFAAVLLVVAAVIAAAGAYLLQKTAEVDALATQLGVQKITLNPGGGRLSNGTDGIRFTINADAGNDGFETTIAGQDALLYRGTYQYCCSAGAPMLNIGGQLYGQAGPAYNSTAWTSIEVLATSGVTTVGARTSDTGNSSALIRYTVVRSGRTFTIDRTVSYTYPNDYVTDDYDFIIPEGNTEQVKFYIGGDTAPGSSDQGYGIMLTDPVRSVISLNTSSKIMFGFREVAGSRQFDGATSQAFSVPYATVQSGGNIGYVGTASNHDAGLMMQWNLGTTPGTYEGKFEQFATRQGTNLNAAFYQARVATGQQATLNLSIANSELSTITGLGYTFTLLEGLLIDGAAISGCSGTLTATVGGDEVTLSGVSIAGASNCVVAVPVASATSGAFTITSANASGLQGVLTNNIGSSTLNVGVYTMTFVSQGGSAIADVSAEMGEQVVVPVSSRPGYDLTEWNTAVNGSGTSYEPGATISFPGADTTLYALWAPTLYEISYNTQGGAALTGDDEVAYNQEIELPLPVRDGYEFIEWNTLADGTGDGYDAGDSFYMPGSDVTLYARWVQLFTLTTSVRGVASTTELRAGATTVLPDAVVRDGYEFIGWNTRADGEGLTYAAEATYTMPSADTTLYAVWEDNDELSLEDENAAVVGGDANGDGEPDSQQSYVSSFVSPLSEKPVSLEVLIVGEEAPQDCTISSVASVAHDELGSDSLYDYPVGLLDFTVSCGAPGFTATVTQYYYDLDDANFVLRKFVNGSFVTIEDARIEKQTINSLPVWVVSYEVTDGGALDADGEENGVIVDPAGPAVRKASAATAPNTGLGQIDITSSLALLVAGGILVAISALARRLSYDRVA